MSKENNDEVQNIITNHIYGNNNSTNVAAGVSVNQNLVHNYLTDEDWAKLKTLGISEIQIEELKKIVETSCNDKLTFVGKTMKWLGSVSASVAGRGLYENIPATTDFIHKMTL